MTAPAEGSLADHVTELRRRAAADRAGAREAAWNDIVALRKLAESDADAADRDLNELFRLGEPVTDLDGPTDGILVMTTTNPVTDAAVKAVTSLWMPWNGKRFDATTGSGDNRMTDSSALVSKLLWPLYSMTDAKEGKLAFDFKTYLDAGKDDPDRQVLVIDYTDIESNPRLVIRSIRDELVDIDGGHRAQPSPCRVDVHPSPSPRAGVRAPIRLTSCPGE